MSKATKIKRTETETEKESEWRILISDKSAIIGKKIKDIESVHNIKISRLDNFNDRLSSFFAKKPPHNRIIRTEDSLTVVGKFATVRKFSKVAW
jgi:Trk K+ transport system NAD-binding subunit